jgi:hypothetical protein
MAFLARLAGTLTRPVALRDGGDRGRGPGAAGGSGVERLSAAWLGERLGGWEDAGPDAGIGVGGEGRERRVSKFVQLAISLGAADERRRIVSQW